MRRPWAAASKYARKPPAAGSSTPRFGKGVGSQMESRQTCEIVTDPMMLKNFANFAEMDNLTIMKQKRWSVPAESTTMVSHFLRQL